MRFDRARAVLADAVARAAFPAAVVEVGTGTAVLWREAFGRLAFDDDAPPAKEDTIFDLASLTKVIATTPLLMQLVERGTLGLDDPVGRYLARWRGIDREDVTIRDFLSHCGGLTAYLPFYRDHQGRAEFEAGICALPLEYTPRTRSIYSDLGFILLAFIIQDAGAARFPGARHRIPPWARADFHYDVARVRTALAGLATDFARIPEEKLWAVLEHYRRTRGFIVRVAGRQRA